MYLFGYIIRQLILIVFEIVISSSEAERSPDNVSVASDESEVLPPEEPKVDAAAAATRKRKLAAAFSVTLFVMPEDDADEVMKGLSKKAYVDAWEVNEGQKLIVYSRNAAQWNTVAQYTRIERLQATRRTELVVDEEMPLAEPQAEQVPAKSLDLADPQTMRRQPYNFGPSPIFSASSWPSVLLYIIFLGFGVLLLFIMIGTFNRWRKLIPS